MLTGSGLKKATRTLGEALRTASTVHVVYFLLTGYVDAVNRSSRLNRLPTAARQLPLAGESDLESRIRELEISAAAFEAYREEERVALQQTLALFRCAHDRIRQLTAMTPSESAGVSEARQVAAHGSPHG